MAGLPYPSVVCVLALPFVGIGPMAVVHPGNPDEQRENKRERERETGRWGLRERQGEAEGKRERERGTDGMRPELL